MKYLGILSVTTFALLGCAGPMMVRKSDWTVQETAQWYSKYRGDGPGAVQGLYYQGSDKQHHYFTARAVDDWVLIRIRKSELTLDDERMLKSKSDVRSAYYRVDPSRDFAKSDERN